MSIWAFDILRPLEEKFLLRVTRQMSTKVCKGPSLSQLSTKKWMNGDVYNDYNVPYCDRFPNLETLLIVEGYLAEPTWIEPRNFLTQWISSMDHGPQFGDLKKIGISSSTSGYSSNFTFFWNNLVSSRFSAQIKVLKRLSACKIRDGDGIKSFELRLLMKGFWTPKIKAVESFF